LQILSQSLSNYYAQITFHLACRRTITAHVQQGNSRMKTWKRFFLVLSALSTCAFASAHSCAEAAASGKRFEGQIAPILEGMGKQNFPSTSSNPLVLQFYNQAIALSYGFNHLEAGRSFEQIAVLEPNSPMAYWGQALVLGPNINGAMEADAVQPAYDAIQKAISLLEFATKKEKDLIRALSRRYSQDTSLQDRPQLDTAYADAMRELVKKYPQDPHIRTFFAESLMVIHAWDYWHSDGRPKEWTPEILAALEAGLKNHPRHAGLIHYYIHATEASKNPGRAEQYADALRDLVPGAGHLVHMPSHIYIRVGRYQDGVIANEKAMQVDDNYISQCRAQGVYPVAYVPHNRHFLWAMATLQGNSEKAIRAAEHMSHHIDTQLMQEPGLGTLQHYWVTPLYAYVRFGKWESILKHKKPSLELKYPLGIWHYARGIAFTAQNKLDRARLELAMVKSLARDNDLQEVTVWDINNAQSVLTIAALALEGEIEGKALNFEKSIEAFEAATKLEDQLNYNEPSDWHYPTRQSLGAILLAKEDFKAAEIIYREDLHNFPNNGWSLFGLYKALEAQGKSKEAQEARKQFEESWRYADIELGASRVL
jgi:tetratricopeptide (TPR) repeat protein